MPLPAPPPQAQALPPVCLNCSQGFGEPRPAYCPACGQETNAKPPLVREFIQQLGGAYFSTEGALWRTLRLLLLRPGELTAQYLAGRRKHYVLPLRLFLTTAVVMLLVMRVAGMLALAPADDPEFARTLPDKPRRVHLELGLGRAGLDEGAFYCESLPRWLCSRLQARLDVNTRAMVQQMRSLNDRVSSNAAPVMCALMPVFAFGLWLIYRNRRMRYTEHLVFALHLHAFWFVVIAVMMLGLDLLVLAGMVVIPVYGLLAMRRVYAGGWLPLLLRATVLGVAHSLLVAATVVCLAVVALLL